MLPERSTRSRSLHHLIALLTTLAVLLALQPAGAVPSIAAPVNDKVQPQLRLLAARQPERQVGVIVQLAPPAAGVEQAAQRLGATVVRDLGIIHALDLELPASAVLPLAAHPDVRWISLNGEVLEQQALDVATTWATELGSYDRLLNARAEDFNSTPIAAGTTIWFSSVVKTGGLTNAPAAFSYSDALIEFSADGVNYSLPVPDGRVNFVPGITQATTVFDAAAAQWVTTVPARYGNEIFLTGLAFQAPVNLPGGIKDVRWSGRMRTDTSAAKIDWKWAAATYGSFSADYTALNVKPIRDRQNNPYANSDAAGAPQAFRQAAIKGARGNGGTNHVGNYSSWREQVYTFDGIEQAIDAPIGPADTFAAAGRSLASFGGFAPAMIPGYTITKVELLLDTYVSQTLDKDPKLIALVGTQTNSMSLARAQFNGRVGSANRDTVAYDITGMRAWSWVDFEQGVELTLDQTDFGAGRIVYYDAIGLRISSVPGQSAPTPATTAPVRKVDAVAVDRLQNTYNFAVNAPSVWNTGQLLQGQGVTVAVVDSGIFKTSDLKDAIVRNVNFSQGYRNSDDQYGHGTFVAGVIAGDGHSSKGAHVGIAPRSNILNVRSSNDEGMATEADVVAGLQWVLENHRNYNIRVVNLSLNAATPQSYHTSPLAAACEVLWFNGIVVVVSAGNNGAHDPGVLLPPANDPFVITVGAADDRGTRELSDDQMAAFSAYGVTPEGYAKPELVAPGVRIIGPLPNNDRLNMSRNRGGNRLDKSYFRMSGTSMAAPMVSGAVAILLQDEPNLTPDQVKFRLMSTANRSWPGYNQAQAGAGYLDIRAAVYGTSNASSNTGVTASQMLWTGSDPVNWGSVNWGSVNWGSVNWGSVNWGSVNWSSDYWGD